MPLFLIRIILEIVFLCILAIADVQGGSEYAYAGTPDKFGNNADVYSISVTPGLVPSGTYPAIVGFIHNTSSLKNRNHGKAVLDVTALITYPNGAQKSYLWHDVNFTANQRKSYTCGNNYDIHQIGIYKVTYSVYNSGKKHRYKSLSKYFTVSNPSEAAHTAPSSETTKKTPEGERTRQALRESVPAESAAQEMMTKNTGKLSTHDRQPLKVPGAERQLVGIGGYINALNFSGGPTLILWPLRNLAVQGTYGVGTFTSYEARVFYRFFLSQHLHPYVGAGYLHAERSAHVLGVAVKIADDGFTAFGGVEIPINKRLSGYIDVSGTSMKLKKDVANGGSQATATVKYSPISVSTGLVLYLF